MKAVRLSEGLLIAAGTLLGYIVAFEYEIGYSGYYGIPREIIAVSLVTILNSVLATFAFLVIVAYVLNIPVIFLRKEIDREDNLRSRVVVANLGFLALLVALIRGLGFEPWLLVGFAFFVLLLNSALLLPGFFADRKENPGSVGFWERVERGFKPAEDDLFSRIYRAMGLTWLAFYMGSSTLIVVGWLAGTGAARTKTDFLATNTHAIIAVYGDRYILKSYDRSSKILGSNFLIKNPEDISSMHFKLTELKSRKNQ